jgi:hypothetical protein
MPGVWTWGFGEQWGLHFLDSVASNHNSLGRGYETFGNGTAETVERKLRNQRYVDKPVTEREWYRPWPPDKTLVWSLRNNTNYMESGCLSILDYTAKNAKEMLRNFYRKGYNSWQKGVKGNPYAFVIAEDQGDPRRVGQMIELLRNQRIEVSRLTAPVTVKEGSFAKGAFVVRLDQPYRNYAVDLLEAQKFPETPYEPYDDVSWAFPVHYGLEAKRVDDAGRPLGVPGAGHAARLRRGPRRGQRAGLPAARHGAGGPARRALPARLVPGRDREKPFRSETSTIPRAPGSCRAGRPGRGPLGRRRRARPVLSRAPPRAVGRVARGADPADRVWHLWSDTEATGWLRMALDQEKVPYDYIRDEEIRAGRLKDKYDVLLYGDNDDSWKGRSRATTRSRPDALHEDRTVPEPRRPDASTTPRAASDGPDGEPAGVPERGRADGHDRQRLRAAARGRARAARRHGGRVRHAGRRAEGEVLAPPTIRSPTGTRWRRRVSHGPADVLGQARDKRFMVLQWGTRPTKEERDFDGAKDEGEAGAADKREKPKEPSGSMVVSGGGKNLEKLEGHPAILDVRRKGPRHRVQLLAAAPGPEPFRPAIPLERDPELERASAECALGDAPRRRGRLRRRDPTT